MSSQIKPIKLWGHAGPNPLKVSTILEELRIPYEVIEVALSDVKKAKYTAINPNGRLPAIYDPNTDITLWESGAIVEYLIDKYDTDHRLGFPSGTPEYYHARQWLFFQTTGQAPYYGQAVWFNKYHPERIPSAIERYVNEIKRVTGVLERHLAKQAHDGDGPWLVGNRFSYADAAFVSWQTIVAMFWEKEEFGAGGDGFPEVKGWMGRMMEREKVKKVMDSMQAMK